MSTQSAFGGSPLSSSSAVGHRMWLSPIYPPILLGPHLLYSSMQSEAWPHQRAYCQFELMLSLLLSSSKPIWVSALFSEFLPGGRGWQGRVPSEGMHPYWMLLLLPWLFPLLLSIQITLLICILAIFVITPPLLRTLLLPKLNFWSLKVIFPSDEVYKLPINVRKVTQHH